MVVLGALLLLGCGDAALESSTGVVHFGEVYVSTTGQRTVQLSETGGTAVQLVDTQLTGADVSSFGVVGGPPPARVVPASSSMPVTLNFVPAEARRYGDADLRFTSITPVTFGNFPVTLRGLGVYQKREPFFRILAGDHSPNAPLEFGRVSLGASAGQVFAIQNESNQDLQATVHWVAPNSDFSVALPGRPVTVRARGTGVLALNFAPTQLGDRWAVVELRSGRSMAGIVLHGTGVIMPVSVSRASLSPSTVSPGESITVSYMLNHPSGNLGQIQSVTLEGLPPNAPTPPTLPPPANGVPVVQTITVGPPAMDGIYPLKLVIQQTGGAPVTQDLGNLTVRDVPATVIGPVIRDNQHSRSQCETPVRRTIEYRVRDENGASDVYLARIDELQPLPGADGLITMPPTVPLIMPRNPNVVEDVATTPDIFVNCRSRPETWTLILKWQEDDKTVTPAAQVERLRHTLQYRVTP